MLSEVDLLTLCDYCELDENLISNSLSSITEPFPALSESRLTGLMQTRSTRDAIAYNFLAAGCYSHFIPAVIMADRQYSGINSPVLSAYTGDNSKHCVQQFMAQLTAMPNCSLFPHDVTTLLANLLTSVAAGKFANQGQARSKVLIPSTVSPAIRSALRTQLKFQPFDLVVVDYDKKSGGMTMQQLDRYKEDDIVAVVLAWPNFFGMTEDIQQISNWARNKDSAVICLSDPMSLALLESPFVLAEGKIDFLLGDLHTLGLSPAQQAESPTFLASVKEPGNNLDVYAKAQRPLNYLTVIHSYIVLFGVVGLHQRVNESNKMLALLVDKLNDIQGISVKFSARCVNECVIELEQIDIERALQILAGHNMVLGHLLQNEYPELASCMLINCSDRHTQTDIDKLVAKVATVVKNLSTAGCPVKPKFS